MKAVYKTYFWMILCGLMGCAASENTADTPSGLNMHKQDQLLAGKAARPTLKSLNLQPAHSASAYHPADDAQHQLTPDHLAQPTKQVPLATLRQMRDEYASLLPMIVDLEQRQQVQARLADINIVLAERALESSTSVSTPLFGTAIEGYQNLVARQAVHKGSVENPLSAAQHEDNAALMDAYYQLARALDLAGDIAQSIEVAKAFHRVFSAPDFAVTQNHIELWFRIAEYYFSRQNYQQAIRYYGEVLLNERGVYQTDFFAIAAYMQGWSYFKLDDYDNALAAFNSLLSYRLDSLTGIDEMPLEQLPLSKGQLRLVQDSIRIMALTFSYRGDHRGIRQFYRSGEMPSYVHLLYAELAQQHLDNERYVDSAQVLLDFAQRYPVHTRAVDFFVRHIDAYILGDFPSEVFTAKKAFVRQYALGNGVVTHLNTPIGRQATPYLLKYLPELAQSEHRIAQQLTLILQQRGDESRAPLEFVQQPPNAESLYQRWQPVDTPQLRVERDQALTQAVDYYRNYINTFEADTAHQQAAMALRFFMAEALFSLGRYHGSIIAFEHYAFAQRENPKAADAAYAAILAWEQLSDLPTGSQVNTAAPHQPQSDVVADLAIYSPAQLSKKRFVEHFAKDRRALPIAVMLMHALFKQQSYEAAIEWASWVLSTATQWHSPTEGQFASARLVTAHAHYALEHFVEAEKSYAMVLAQSPQEDPNRQEWRNAYAASIFKQAQLALHAVGIDNAFVSTFKLGDSLQQESLRFSLNEAISHLTRLRQLVPNAPLSVDAWADIATYSALLGNWPFTIQTWLAFQQQHPHHPYSQTIPDQLLFAYQHTEQWEFAAEMLLARYQQDPQSTAARTYLLSAAEYFLAAGNRTKSLNSYRTYAHAFPQPMADANEARMQMSEFYLASNEPQKRRFWLNKMLRAQLDLGGAPANSGTVRSRYLAAMSAMVFANDADYIFKRIKLNMPLKESLQSKQRALKKAVAAYEQVMAMGVAKFTTEANYNMGQLYSTLGADLLDSERPTGLSDLELEEYDFLLEDQAFAFESTAIAVHESNINWLKSGIYDDFVKQSFAQLSLLMPARYNKPIRLDEVTADDL